MGGELKAQAGWAVGTGLWAKGQRRAAAWAIWITKHRSPLQPHPGDPQPPAPCPPGIGEGQSQLHLGPSPRGGSSQPPPPTWGTPGRAGLWHGRPGAVIVGKKAGAPGCDPVRVYLPSANMAWLSPSPEGQAEAQNGELTCLR